MIHILGGKTVAVNFHLYLNKNKIESKIYFFENEAGAKLKSATSFINNWKRVDFLTKKDKIIVSSETAFNNLQSSEIFAFKNHSYLRDKLNISSISKEIGVKEIPFVNETDIINSFPVIAKPKRSGSNVPFKFKVVKNGRDFSKVQAYIKDCIFQKYFSPLHYIQIAVAGYYLNNEKSLISVEQLNQYPIGVSSHVKLIGSKYDNLKKRISDYLNQIGFIGFIEFEFKIDKRTEEVYLIDINPRLWGWSYYYFSAIQNIHEVLFENKTPILKIKSEWVNLPRYILSLSQMRFTMPNPKNVLLSKISFEPLKI